ncbi:MAG: hypothetical protein IPM16_10155 [Chloroflexi bacterium]|nr:hypothetical protein [Chloroflexota bacterium]
MNRRELTRYDNSIGNLPYLAREWFRLHAQLYVLRKTPIVLYSTGGSGSNSVAEALDRRGAFTLHTHMLTDDALTDDRLKPRRWRWIKRHIVDAQRRTLFIATVRDPIAVMVSGFFMRVPPMRERAAAKGRVLTVEKALDRFLNKYIHGRYTVEFFDRQIQPVLGIDVYRDSFPREQGWATYTKGPFSLLVVRSELPDEAKAEAIGAFTGVQGLSIPRVNRSDQKDYAELRREFDARLTIPDEILDTYYESRLAQHFFSPEERAAMRAKWGTPRERSITPETER